VHLKNLKPAPISSPLVDSCIECGFCESNCPSRSVSLTPRQRITSYREMSRLKQIENPTAEQAKRCTFDRTVVALLLILSVSSISYDDVTSSTILMPVPLAMFYTRPRL